MVTGMQDIGRALGKKYRKTYGKKKKAVRSIVPNINTEGNIHRPRPANMTEGAKYTKYRPTTGTKGHKRYTAINPAQARAKFKTVTTQKLKDGSFMAVAETGEKGVYLQKSLVEFARATHVSPLIVHKLRAFDPDKLYALLTANKWNLNIVFSYEEDGFDYEDEVNYQAQDNLEMVCNEYERVFGKVVSNPYNSRYRQAVFE